MEGKDSKQYYLFVKGKKVWVEEEVYRAYVRPISAAKKAEERNLKCLVRGKNGRLIRCNENCKNCKYYEEGNILPGGIISLDGLMNCGYEGNADIDMEDEIISTEQIGERSASLRAAFEKLNERQRYIIWEIYFNKRSQVELAGELGIDKTSMSKAVSRALKSMKKFFEEF